MERGRFFSSLSWLRLLFRAFRYRFFRQSNYLWSRGFYRECNWAGNSNFFYPAYPTRYRVNSLASLVGKKGIIWLRLGSEPAKPEFDNGSPGDVVIFANEIIGKLGGKVVLVTTDGDRSIPSGLPQVVVDKIISDPNIVAWYTQNLEHPVRHRKLYPIPIGMDLHTRISSRLNSPMAKQNLFENAINDSLNISKRKFRIWSDVHLEADLGQMLEEFPEDMGKPDAKYYQTRNELRQGIGSGQLVRTVDSPKSRLPLKELWKTYGSYTFVISLPGHGIDCHRTWEALSLGAIVITVSTPIDELLRPFRVVFVERGDSEWWREFSDPTWLEWAYKEGASGQPVDLSWEKWISPMRNCLTINNSG